LKKQIGLPIFPVVNLHDNHNGNVKTLSADMIKKGLKRKINLPYLEIAYTYIQAYGLNRIEKASAS